MSLPSIPTSFDFTLHGGIDAGLDDIRIKELPTIRLNTDSKVDAGLDDIRIKELPRIELDIGVKPTRVHAPSHYQVCFAVMGMEMFKFSLCGESMVITEPYVQKHSERCG